MGQHVISFEVLEWARDLQKLERMLQPAPPDESLSLALNADLDRKVVTLQRVAASLEGAVSFPEG